MDTTGKRELVGEKCTTGRENRSCVQANQYFLTSFRESEKSKDTMTDRIRVLICGTGSGAHALAAVASRNPRFEVRVLTLSVDRARRWTEIMRKERLTMTVCNGNDSQIG